MRKVAVVSVGRSDYGLYRPLLRAIESSGELELALIAGAAHLPQRWGRTLSEIERDGFAIAARVDCSLANDSPGALSRTMGLAMIEFAGAYERLRPDLLVVLGDRYEMFAAASASVPFQIPLAHLCGGCVTQGAIDDVFRHGISKMAHWHFVEMQESADRLARLGEAAWRIHVTGLIGLDNLRAIEPLDRAALAALIGGGFVFDEAPVLATFHPETRDFRTSLEHFDAMLWALREFGAPVVFTSPNADTGSGDLVARIKDYLAGDARSAMVEHFGTAGYYSMMKYARLMVGNSSSGLLEAPSFGLPVVNVGDRQKGRHAPGNVVHAPASGPGIVAAMRRCGDDEFAGPLAQMRNPYGDGTAARQIVEVLKTATLDAPLLMKEDF